MRFCVMLRTRGAGIRPPHLSGLAGRAFPRKPKPRASHFCPIPARSVLRALSFSAHAAAAAAKPLPAPLGRVFTQGPGGGLDGVPGADLSALFGVEIEGAAPVSRARKSVASRTSASRTRKTSKGSGSPARAASDAKNQPPAKPSKPASRAAKLQKALEALKALKV